MQFVKISLILMKNSANRFR